jgi:hypothetical protein
MKRAFLLALFLPLSAAAAVVSEGPFTAAATISGWQRSFAVHAERAGSPAHYTECREVGALPGTVLCQFTSGQSMNQALARATIFAEGPGNFAKGTLARLGTPELTYVAERISGHDLLGADLAAFHRKANEECARSGDRALCLSPAEEEFFRSLVLPKLSEGRPLVVITFAHNGRAPLTTVAHEILHAQYFLDSAYREAIDSYWNEDLSEEGRASVRRMLGVAYDTANEYLMRNEFQAYLLEPGAENGMLGQFVAPMRKPLLLRLQERGLAPITIH